MESRVFDASYKYWDIIDEADAPWLIRHPLVRSTVLKEMEESKRNLLVSIHDFAVQLLERQRRGEVHCFSFINEGLHVDSLAAEEAELANLRRRLKGERLALPGNFDLRDALWAAVEALELYQDGEHYFVLDEDGNATSETGRPAHSIVSLGDNSDPQPDLRWTRYIHSDLEIEHRAPVKDGGRIEYMMTPQYMYRHAASPWSAVTGSKVSETTQSYFRNQYGALWSNIELERELDRKVDRAVGMSRYFSTFEEMLPFIVEFVKENYKKGNPILVSARSPNEAEIIAKWLRSADQKTHFLKDADSLRLITGKNAVSDIRNTNRIADKFAVTVSGPQTDRGTEVKANITLLHADTGVSAAAREQVEGRTARGGWPGTYQMCAYVIGNKLLTQYAPEELAEFLELPFNAHSPAIPLLFELAQQRRQNALWDYQSKLVPHFSTLIETHLAALPVLRSIPKKNFLYGDLFIAIKNFINKAFFALQKMRDDEFEKDKKDFDAVVLKVRNNAESISVGSAAETNKRTNGNGRSNVQAETGTPLGDIIAVMARLHALCQLLNEPGRTQLSSAALDGMGNLLTALRRLPPFKTFSPNEMATLVTDIPRLDAASQKLLPAFIQSMATDGISRDRQMIYGMPVAQLLVLIKPFVPAEMKSQRAALLKKLNADPQAPLLLAQLEKIRSTVDQIFSSSLAAKGSRGHRRRHVLVHKIFSQ